MNWGGGNFQIFNVTNNGQATAENLAVSLDGGDPSQFDLVRPWGRPGPDGPCVYLTKLDPGQTCFQQVFFIPNKSGPQSTTLVLTADPGGTVTAPLTGIGTAMIITPCCGASFNSESADGVSTKIAVFTVTNNGPDTTSLVVGLQGGNPSQFDLYRPSPAGDCVYRSQLGPGESCSQTVLFNPTKTGFFTSTVVATGNPAGTATYGLNGSGV